jgi:hypothetical protein
VIEITNGKPWQNPNKISVLWRGAGYHCQVAEFLLHKHKNIKNKFRASNTLLNSAEYAITRKEHLVPLP